MCGICGFNWDDKSLIRDMANIMDHRGPDQKGDFVDEGVSIGHSRLSIIDLSEKGKQPMKNEDGSLQIVFNGEIYNFKELRDVLEKQGHSFFSNTDTEVIIHAYEQWGVDCVKRLRGMFAFAIWDSKNKQFFLARDRVGIKPLYYYFDSGKFMFASEIKAILLNPEVKREVDNKSLYYFMGYEFVPTPFTLFKSIKKLPPAHTLIFKNNDIKLSKYWDLKFSKENSNESVLTDQIYNLLQESVRLRLISDVPLGAFLSGGIDSSAIVGLMSQMTDEPVKTFTIGYEDESYSELPYARQVADYFGTDHTEIIIDPGSIEHFEKSVWYLDEPMTDPSLIPAYLFCKEAKKDVTVCLSGEGGDEVFLGYDRFVASKMDSYYRIIPEFLRKNFVSHIVGMLPPQQQKKGVINVVKRFIEGSDLPLDGWHMRWQYFSNKNEEKELYKGALGQMMNNINPFEHLNDYYMSCNLKDRVAREQYMEMKSFLVDNVLVKVDRMSMANALEVRVPYLDHKFLELCATIPGSLKLNGLTTKYILKKSMLKLLPKNIVNRKKQGFSFPIKNWLRYELKEYMQDMLFNSEIIKENFDPTNLNKLVEQHLRGTQNHSHRLWALMNLEMWHRTFIQPEVFINDGKHKFSR
ncbi:MAG: asparagine synthase (glutamine-hydrolyzing) [Candidatus Methanoperedens sp.]|nr:asparagine synthase (glutamine-hydrolyzing) [Candidatus Methanoperedens sp.]